MSSVVVIADDLTGANATGALLARRGFRVASCPSLEQWDEKQFAAFDVVAINAASRLLPEAEAKRRVQCGVEMALSLRPKVVGKRIDSTLRGNLGAEIEAALAALEANKSGALALVVPAFPASGRVVVGGMVLVNGTPLEKTSIAADPVTPIFTSPVLPVIARQSSLHGETLPLTTILQGVEATRNAVMELWRQGCRMIVADAATNEDIASLAEAVRDVDFPVLAVDPGPFSAAMGVARVGAPQQEGRILAVVGSVTEATQQQLETLSLARNCHFVLADCGLLVNPATREAEIARIAPAIAAAPPDAAILGVCAARRPEHVRNLSELGAQFQLARHEVSESINNALAEVAFRLLRKSELHIAGLYVSGGEATTTVTRRLQAAGLRVRDEVLPLAMFGSLIGGLYPDLPVVTKGGFVGDAHGLTQCVDYLIKQGRVP
ncbi:MAG: four-carbon acid sugar kinase family protein [Deltaproteobacteria bacterium]|jgi:uncharacterized protein YgbK (DUF1537 family)|nr:four-carbon acid sugar kinase family protein [Deltaproteobacteria bacterium]